MRGRGRALNADSAKLQLDGYNGGPAQQWSRILQTWRALGKCLDVAGASTANGTKVQLYTCHGGDNQGTAPAR